MLPSDSSALTLICAPHGTASADGLATLAEFVDAVQAKRPGHDVRTAYLDVAEPSLAAVAATVDTPAVVVPILLAAGYHVRTDVPAVLAGHPHIRALAPLGPDPAITTALVERLRQARGDRGRADVVVLLAAGSTDANARADVTQAADDLAVRLGEPVEVAVLGGPGARLAEVVARHPGQRIDVATYLLAPGAFAARAHAQAEELGIEVVTQVLGAHPSLVELVWDRFDKAASCER